MNIKKRKLDINDINISNVSTCSKKGVNIKFLRKLRSIFSSIFPNVDINFYQTKATIKEWTSVSKFSLVDELDTKYQNIKHPELELSYSEAASDTATVFVSYSWSYSFFEVIDVLEKYIVDCSVNEATTYFWLDFVIASQWPKILPPEWWATAFRSAIQSIGTTLLVMLPWNGQATSQNDTVLSRTWCLYEVYVTITTKSDLLVGWNRKGESEMLNSLRNAPDLPFSVDVDIQKSKTSQPEDRNNILTTVMNDIGFDSFNLSLSETIQKQIEKVVMKSFTINVGVKISFLRELKHLFNDKDMYEIQSFIKPINKKSGAFMDHFIDNSICLNYDLKIKYPEFVGDATVFVSYPWSIKYKEFLDAIESYLIMNQNLKESETFFYIDLFCREQLIAFKVAYKYHDWVDITTCRFTNLHNALTIIGPTWEEPTLYERLWLLFEIQVGRLNNVNIQFSSSTREQQRFLDFMVSNDWDHINSIVTKEIDINNCQCSHRKDYDLIMNYFRCSKDGIEGLVDFIVLKRLEWMICILEMNVTTTIPLPPTAIIQNQENIKLIENRLLKLYRLHFLPSRQLSR